MNVKINNACKPFLLICASFPAICLSIFINALVNIGKKEDEPIRALDRDIPVI